MVKKSKYQSVQLQKQVQLGSSEPEFQGEALWEGLEDTEHLKDSYFSSYSYFGIHEDMLKDQVRTESYMHAIANNPQLFQGKTVLDVGCGTGVLSIFAARAGAAKVYAVDAADIVQAAAQIILDNGFADIITTIQGKVEEIELPVDKVDIIISEWMGYFLLYESMLETVLFARDKWLRPGGLMFPDKATVYIAGIEDADFKESKFDFWDSVHGLNMSVMKDLVTFEPIVDYVEASAICTTTCPIFTANLESVDPSRLEYVSSYSLRAMRTDHLHALVAWFEVQFTHGTTPITLSTSPREQTTHWKQTVFYLDVALPMLTGEELRGSFAVRRSRSSPRDRDVQISYHFDGMKDTLHSHKFYSVK
jgi:protein arginine N-methyltransferase 1